MAMLSSMTSLSGDLRNLQTKLERISWLLAICFVLELIILVRLSYVEW
jgi:hypothetical protein